MHQIFAFALGLEVEAVAFAGIGIQRTHVQQPADTAGNGGIDNLLRQLHVCPPEAGFAPAGFIQDAHQVDDRGAAGKLPAQLRAVVDVGLSQRDVRIDAERAVPLRPARQYAHPVSVAGQPVGQMGADEAAAAEYADGFLIHVFSRVACVAGRRCRTGAMTRNSRNASVA